MQGEMMKMKK